MRRRIALITVFLLLGAIVNVAVAWGFIAYPNKFPLAGRPTSESVDLTEPLTQRDRDWLEYARWREAPLGPREYQPALLYVNRSAAVEVRTFYIFQKPSIESGRGEHMISTTDLQCIRAGWPLEALEGGIRTRIRHFSRANVRQHFDAVALLPFDVSAGAFAIGLPLRPILPGFLINTLLYAALLWLLVTAPFTTRRMIRRRRGLCEKCAYPIGASPVCTECGAALSPYSLPERGFARRPGLERAQSRLRDSAI